MPWAPSNQHSTGIAHAVDVSNIVGLVMIAALVGVSVVLIQRPRKIIQEPAEQT
ncbi:hypothetical protein ABGB18_19795 [Nonomuraea sp. B12E4]|uniref:hypothetical protein n=1 Tax=Nonomuraea sp. B12E4 TaxID=3153564 RepID=UPI00325F6157